MPNTSGSTLTSDEMQARWQAFCRTKEFQEAAKWVADGDFPGALFVAFRAGAASAHPSCTQVCVTQRVEGAIPPGSREALRQALRGTAGPACAHRPSGCQSADAARYAQLKAAYSAASFDPSSLDLEGAVALIFTFPNKDMHISGNLDETLDAARIGRAGAR